MKFSQSLSALITLAAFLAKGTLAKPNPVYARGAAVHDVAGDDYPNLGIPADIAYYILEEREPSFQATSGDIYMKRAEANAAKHRPIN